MLKKYGIKYSGFLLIIGFLATSSAQAFADTNNPTTGDTEKAYLIQMMNQLDAIQPFILAAKNVQLPDKRVQFHYSRYQNSQGQYHNGLLEDVQSIKAGIAQYINQPAIEPRIVQPLQGDYLSLQPVPDNQHALVAPNLEVPHADG